ncbi:PREDICTED: uncharacterized protein LOC109240198 [Nicotiana attenuata]|uniref:uncharacterized protein LOC109240198 n=1 Tax=Nicotiana attenuata TaxID=49451 RepID=UPI0009051C88|nr:PREDICTED: uncharacterized protein LOC109240198 [Nicotiana attenuata]
MEKYQVIFPLLVFFGFISFSLCIAAEFKKSKKWNGGCRISFGIAVILIGASTSMSRNQHFGEGWLDGECYIVKDGVYTGSAILVLVTLSSTLGSAIMRIRKRNQVEQDSKVLQQVLQ